MIPAHTGYFLRAQHWPESTQLIQTMTHQVCSQGLIYGNAKCGRQKTPY